MEEGSLVADDERTIELSTIEAIFPEIVLDSHSPYQAFLKIPIQPATPLRIRFQHPTESSIPHLLNPSGWAASDFDDQNVVEAVEPKLEEGGTDDVHRLVHLPPLHLKIDLPEGYPAEKAPNFELSSSPDWMPKAIMQRLKTDAPRLWEESGRDQVVFTYIDHLQQAAEAGFDLGKGLAQDITVSRDLKIALLDYDQRAKREAFEKSTYDCGVCLEPKNGAVCHRLFACSHVFCVECLQDCYNKCIAEGDVDNVKCLHPGCGKDLKERQLNEANGANQMFTKRRRHDPTLSPSELLQVPLGEEVVQRYVYLKRKKRLESDKNTVYCPRQWCQGAARSKKHPKPIDPVHEVDETASDSETESVTNPTKASQSKEIPMAERLRICEDCSYAFCSVCQRGWHGEMLAYNRCNPRSQKDLSEEEKATKEYLAKHSTQCPVCAAPCQKTGGCNHMICFTCNTDFCYLCSSNLQQSNPYQHFNQKHNPCYMRLWELEEGDDENAEVVVWNVPAEEDDDSDVGSEDGHNIWRPNVRLFENPLPDHVAQFADEDEPAQEPLQRPQEHPAAPADFRIEIINFARGGAANPQIVQAIPPPIPVPPPLVQAPRRGRGGARQLPRGGGPARGRGGWQQNRNQNGNPGQDRGGAQAGGRGRGRGGRVALAPPAQPRIAAAAAAPEARRRIVPILVDNNDSDSDSSDTEDEVPLHFRRVVAPAPAPGQGNNGQQQPAMLRQMGIDRFLQLAEQDQEDEWDSDELEEGVEDLVEERRTRALNRRMWG